MMIEQPLDYDDIADHAALQRGSDTNLPDESIKTAVIRRDDAAHPAGRLPHHQHQAGGSRVRQSICCTIYARRTAFPVWHGGARVGHRPRRERHVHAADFFAAG